MIEIGCLFACGQSRLLITMSTFCDRGLGARERKITRVRGRSSVAERQLPKLYVVGSIPIARSKTLKENSYWPHKFISES